MRAGHLLRSGNYQAVSGATALPKFKSIYIKSSSTAAGGAGAAVDAAGTSAAAQQAAKQGVLCPCWEVDGEYMGSWCEATIEVLPAALKLCV